MYSMRARNWGAGWAPPYSPEYFVFNKQRKLVYMGLLHNSPSSMRTDGSINYTKGEPTEYHLKGAIEASLTRQAGGTGRNAAAGMQH